MYLSKVVLLPFTKPGFESQHSDAGVHALDCVVMLLLEATSCQSILGIIAVYIHVVRRLSINGGRGRKAVEIRTFSLSKALSICSSFLVS